MTEYAEFLKSKVKFTQYHGIDVDQSDINPVLKPHQRDIVQWACKGGRRAIFASFGLGKTFIQLETLRLLLKHDPGKYLIILPLGVRQEFKHDADLLGIPEPKFIRCNEEIDDDGIYLTNYESVRDGKLTPSLFNGASLDEASCLRSYGSKTFQTFLTLFESVKYRFVATATPSPNRYKELIHYAGFLGTMDTGQALTRYFQRNSQKANELTLYPHKEAEFWTWMHSWAIFLQRPSDLGYSDDGYVLPELNVQWHELSAGDLKISVDRKTGQVDWFTDPSMSLPAAAAEKRDSLDTRIAKMKELLTADPDSHYLLWHDTDAELDAIRKAIPGVAYIHGAMDLSERERLVIAFSNGELQYLATKPVLSGSGCNFQRFCHKAIYLGIGFKFNDFIQSIHRLQRFLQQYQVSVHLIYTDREYEIRKTLKQKWRNHSDMVQRMSEIIKEQGLSATEMENNLHRSIGIERIEETGVDWLMAHNDCVDETKQMNDNSVDLIVTSIPFANHYEYTPSYNDFGHTDDNDQFWQQMDYLSPQLLRVLAPGRIFACHVKDRINFGNVTGLGFPTSSPFHAEAIFHYQKHGFAYCGMITVVTDVVRENNQTYRLGWSEQCKDGSKMGTGSPEYILLFRKPQSDLTKGYADTPVTKTKDEYTRAKWQIDAHAFWRSSGNRYLSVEELQAMKPNQVMTMFEGWSLNNIYNYEHHVEIGEALDEIGNLPSTFMTLAPGSNHPDVWHDVVRMRTLNGKQTQKGLQNHVCLTRGSLVLTANGYKKIQDIAAGDMVLTHKGRWRKVLVAKKTGFKPVVTVKAQGVPGLTLTPDHKLWAKDVSSYERKSDYARSITPDWLKAEKAEGCYINQKIPQEQPPEIEDMTYWWAVGRWLADGHIDQRGCAVISVGHDKWDYFCENIGKFGGNRPRELTALQIALKDPGHKLRDTLIQCGHGAANKQLPPAAYTLPKNQCKALLDGYLSGDGHLVKGRNRWMASSASKALFLGVSMLVQRVYGAIASIHAGRPDRVGEIEGRTVNMKQEWVLSFEAPSLGRRKQPILLNDGAWKKVRSVEKSGEQETWCIRVEEDESFTAEGCIVKNCPLQIDIVERLIERYSNKGETVFDPFGGLGTVPLTALGMGRKGRGVELNPDYYRDAVNYLKAKEQELSIPDLFAFSDIEAAA